MYCEFSEFLPLVSSLISQTSSIDTNVHGQYESYRELATCVHVIIHPKQTVHALCRKMMNVFTVYQWSMHYLCFWLSCPLVKCWECSITLAFLGNLICLPIFVPLAFLVLSASHQASTCRATILWSIIEYLTFWEAWSNPSYSTVCLHLYSNCFRSNCVQDNNIDYLTIACSCSCATNI